MNAKIIAIGDEILQGQTLNTNANFLAQKLTELSFSIDQMCTIGDNSIAINDALDKSVGKYNLIVFTGGLGPTSDDITKNVLTKYFSGKLIENKEVLSDVKRFVESRNFALNDNNRKQALVPSCCKVVRNPFGTAPGMIFEKNNSTIISLPGVPFEMRQLFEEQISSELKRIFDFPTKCIRFIHTLGLPESILAEKLENFEAELPSNIKMAYLPSPEDIKIRLWTFGGFQKRICEQITDLTEELKTILGNHIFGYGKDTLESVLSDLLLEKNKTVSLAESCTSGKIAHKITSIPGSSRFFEGGIVSYSNEAKINTLKVKVETIEKYGAVSKETVEEMAEGALKVFGTDYSIAVSGIAGPDGGTDEKPVGTTWIAVANKDKIIAKVYKFGTRRDINVRRATATALHSLINFIKQ